MPWLSPCATAAKIRFPRLHGVLTFFPELNGRLVTDSTTKRPAKMDYLQQRVVREDSQASDDCSIVRRGA
jgi:hypothetical protein